MYGKKKTLGNVYRVYGLNVASEITMPELPAAEQGEGCGIDAFIAYGKVSGDIEDGVVVDPCLKLSKREFYLHIKGTARFYVADGCVIVVQPEGRGDEEEIKVFLLGSCLGMLLYQRNIVAMHGGAVVIDGQGIIITGHTGAGKSTLISALREKGHKFLADDVCALTRDDGSNIMIHPSYPQAKLCRDAMERMGYDTENYQRTDPYRDKYIVPLDRFFSGKEVVLRGIYEIRKVFNQKTEINEVLGAEKLKLILRNVYRMEIIHYLGISGSYFKKCLEIAGSVPVYSISRPEGKITVEEQVGLIMDTLRVKTKLFKPV